MSSNPSLIARLENAQTGNELLAVIDAYLAYDFRASVR